MSATLWCSRAGADVALDVPLTVPVAYLERQALELLEIDENGQGVIVADACNRLELWDLKLAAVPVLTEGAPAAVDTIDDDGAEHSRTQELELLIDVATRAHAGASLFGRCRGPGPLEGRVLMRLVPASEETGAAVLFDATAAEFRTADGSEGLLTKPSRVLADTLLVPRLQDMRVDVTDALAQIDALLERFVGPGADGAPALADKGRLTAAAMSEEGMAVTLGFVLADREPLAEPPAETNTEGGLIEKPASSDTGSDTDSATVERATPAPVAALDNLQESDWQRLEDELDGFLTVIVQHLALQAQDRDLQLDFMALLIDVRMRVAALLREENALEGEDPLRQLFLETWSRLSELVSRMPRDESSAEAGLQLASFLAAGDALYLADELGPAYGIEVSRDGLRRLARLLLEGDVPVSFTPLPREQDPAMQALFGFRAAAAVEAGAVDLQNDADTEGALLPPPLSWLRSLSPVSSAYAADPDPAALLRQIFPQRDNLDLYLGVVSSLMKQTLAQHWTDSRLNETQQQLFEPLVRATAWKETCWRHYLPAKNDDESLRVIRSGVGAVGMMQIVGRVWRSLFDLERLEQDVDYNLAAGVDILEHYFLDYAVRRGEHEHPGGQNNLVRATYAAYNGGPSKLNRYRRDGVSARARAVDEQFYANYQTMVKRPWPEESRCYVR